MSRFERKYASPNDETFIKLSLWERGIGSYHFVQEALEFHQWWAVASGLTGALLLYGWTVWLIPIGLLTGFVLMKAFEILDETLAGRGPSWLEFAMVLPIGGLSAATVSAFFYFFPSFMISPSPVLPSNDLPYFVATYALVGALSLLLLPVFIFGVPLGSMVRPILRNSISNISSGLLVVGLSALGVIVISQESWKIANSLTIFQIVLLTLIVGITPSILWLVRVKSRLAAFFDKTAREVVELPHEIRMNEIAVIKAESGYLGNVDFQKIQRRNQLEALKIEDLTQAQPVAPARKKFYGTFLLAPFVLFSLLFLLTLAFLVFVYPPSVIEDFLSINRGTVGEEALLLAQIREAALLTPIVHAAVTASITDRFGKREDWESWFRETYGQDLRKDILLCLLDYEYSSSSRSAQQVASLQ